MQTVGLGGETPWVLLVEDDLDTARVQREALREWEVRHAVTASEARQLLKGQRPILVLLGLGLPDNDGLAVCVEIRRSYSAVDIRAEYNTLDRLVKSRLRSKSDDTNANNPNWRFTTLAYDLNGNARRRRGDGPAWFNPVDR